MSVLVISYNKTGKIVNWRYEANDDYEPADGEFLPPEEVNHRDLDSKRVDVSETPPKLIEDESYDPRSKAEIALEEIDTLKNDNPVRRAKITPKEKRAFKDARDDSDIQQQLDVIYQMLTGEKLG